MLERGERDTWKWRLDEWEKAGILKKNEKKVPRSTE